MPTLPPPVAPGDDDGGAASRGDDHRRPGQGQGDRSGTPAPSAGVEIPDDLSELSEEVDAYRRERRAARRRERLRRIMPVRVGSGGDETEPDGSTSGLPGALLIVVLVLIGALGALLPVLGSRPRVATPPGTAPLATTTVAPGGVGGLLPDLVVNGPARPVRLRDLRPGVVALLPSPCGCAHEIAELVGQTHERRPLPTYLVSDHADQSGQAELATLVSDPLAAGRRAVGLTDPAGAVAALYKAPAKSITLLLVGADGRLMRAPRVLHQGDRLETWLDAPGLLPG